MNDESRLAAATVRMVLADPKVVAKAAPAPDGLASTKPEGVKVTVPVAFAYPGADNVRLTVPEDPRP